MSLQSMEEWSANPLGNSSQTAEQEMALSTVLGWGAADYPSVSIWQRRGGLNPGHGRRSAWAAGGKHFPLAGDQQACTEC